jgi:hypothetical protein
MHTFLVLVAVPVTLLTVLFAGGAFVGLASLGRQGLLPIGMTREAQTRMSLSEPAAPPAGLPDAVNAETFVDAEPAYA